MKHGPEPGSKALRWVVMKLRQLAKQESEHFLKQVLGIRGRHAEPMTPARQDRREQRDKAFPMRLVGRSAQSLQKRYRRFVHRREDSECSAEWSSVVTEHRRTTILCKSKGTWRARNCVQLFD